MDVRAIRAPKTSRNARVFSVGEMWFLPLWPRPYFKPVAVAAEAAAAGLR